MLSPVDPISKAIDRTREALFQPFDLMKWVILGFCVFLAALGEGSGGGFSGSGHSNAKTGNARVEATQQQLEAQITQGVNGEWIICLWSSSE
ncbi:TPA: hypothetical protein DDW35_00735 [Candidatus Sumerlaeota bacterium]|jgi:hypothetical protein|nr:hypothetical protein [Candidatus Sumerlaeota bacterium]